MAPMSAAACACSDTAFREGIRSRLFRLATLMTYDEWTTTSIGLARICSVRGCGAGHSHCRWRRYMFIVDFFVGIFSWVLGLFTNLFGFVF